MEKWWEQRVAAWSLRVEGGPAPEASDGLGKDEAAGGVGVDARRGADPGCGRRRAGPQPSSLQRHELPGVLCGLAGTTASRASAAVFAARVFGRGCRWPVPPSPDSLAAYDLGYICSWNCPHKHALLLNPHPLKNSLLLLEG